MLRNWHHQSQYPVSFVFGIVRKEHQCWNRSSFRQACAIESAARRNPNRDIFVLFASPVGYADNEMLPKYYDTLKNFKNIHWRNMNVWQYSRNTEIYEWLKTDKLLESSFFPEHLSDIVRALSLFRYGGYHLDLDVVVQKSFDDLGEDFISDDWGDIINGAVMHLNNYGIGREILEGFFM